MKQLPSRFTAFPYTTLFRSDGSSGCRIVEVQVTYVSASVKQDFADTSALRRPACGARFWAFVRAPTIGRAQFGIPVTDASTSAACALRQDWTKVPPGLRSV